MSRTGPHKLQRCVQGVMSAMSCWARPAIFPWLVTYRQTRGRLRMKLKVGFLYVLPLFGLQIAALGCNRANPQAAGPQLPPPPLVSVVKAQAQDVPVYLDEIGKSFAFESVTVTPQVGGRITQRQFQDGADLAKGQLLFVIDPRPYQAQLDSAKGTLAQAKAARDLPNVQKEMTRGTLKTLVRLPSDPEEHVRGGKLTFLDNTVQNGTGTVLLRATISNPDHHFWPGQFLNVRLVLATQKGAVLIPNQATQISQKGPFVYVVKPDNTADLRLVTLGQRQGDNVVITQGVAAGENVIVAGQMTVAPNSKVRVDTAGAGPAAGTQPSAPAKAK